VVSIINFHLEEPISQTCGGGGGLSIALGDLGVLIAVLAQRWTRELVEVHKGSSHLTL
jgi:hypothetical protein